MRDPRDIFYKKMHRLDELDKSGIAEIAYEGNIGLHELVQFYSAASEHQKNTLEHYLKTNQTDKALELLAIVTGTQLIVPKSGG